MFRGVLLIGCILMSLAIAPSSPRDLAPHPDAEPSHGGSGASRAFTSHDPIIERALRLAQQGDFSQAQALLQSSDSSGDSGARSEAIEILRRQRLAYTQTSAALLARVRHAIPDATAEDLERWRIAGQVQYRSIDGALFYFNREPANLFRFSEEARRRRNAIPPPAPGWTLQEHLARVIRAAHDSSRPDVVPIRHRVRYSIIVPATAAGLKSGARVRVWLPFPQEYRQQSHVQLISSNPPGPHIAPAAAGEPPRGALQRTLYLERIVGPTAGPLSFEEVFEFTSSAWYPDLDDVKARPLPDDWAGRDLGERLPHIVFSEDMKKTAARIVGDETNPLRKARRIFEYVATHMAYCAEEEYCTMPSLSAKALRTGRGDCGVQTMLFITLCRCAGIPARWQTGWQTKRRACDMHDWCEFYVEPWGWLPADPSYGLQDSPDPAIRWFYFGHQDSYRLIVNRDYGAPLDPPKASLRSEPLDFQRGEIEIDGNNLYFNQWDYDIQIDWLDEGP